MTVIVEPARPKLNLTLTILGRRDDGYHELSSLVAFAAAPADTLTLDTAAAPGISVTGPFAASIAGENLLDKTARLLAEAGIALPGHVTLEKVLPVASGIGGGSADAAAMLRAVRRALSPDHVQRIDWSAMALKLGADVPVCLAGETSYMTGIGETVRPCAGLPRLPAVLVNPMVAVPADKSARVFRALSAPPLAARLTPTRLPEPMTSLADQCVELARFGNDLTAAATCVVPIIDDVLREISACSDCRLARLSGAGPTAFGIFEAQTAADDAARAIRLRRPGWWVTSTTIGDH